MLKLTTYYQQKLEFNSEDIFRLKSEDGWVGVRMRQQLDTNTTPLRAPQKGNPLPLPPTSKTKGKERFHMPELNLCFPTSPSSEGIKFNVLSSYLGKIRVFLNSFT